MSLKSDIAQEQRRNKAFNLRYKKAIPAVLNLEHIRDTIYEIGEEASNIRWWCANEDETMLDELIGDEEESYELRMAFSSLDVDASRMYEDLQNEWVPEFFDDFFGMMDNNGGMLGFDTFEGDYFGLSDGFETDLAVQECRERMKRHTKDELLEAFRVCFRVAINFVSIQSRYDGLKSYIDILHGVNTGYLAQVKQIEDLYEKVSENWEYCNWKDKEAFIKLVDNMPEEAWVM